MKNVLFVVLSSLIFCSCQPIMRLAFGVKKPQYETYATISKFCIQNKMDTTALFVSALDWQTLKAKLKDNLPDDSLQNFGIPKILAFDSKGNPISLQNPAKCTPGALTALEKLQATQLKTSTHNHNLSAYLEKFEGKNQQKVNFENIKDSSDVYIAFFWPKFWPSGTLKYYHELETLVKTQKDIKMKLLLFNCDSPDRPATAELK